MVTDILITPMEPGTKSSGRLGLLVDQFTVNNVKYIMIWYVDGTPKSYATFDDNDEGAGISVDWFPDGSIKEYFFHKDGIPHGELRKWNSHAELVSKTVYVNGVDVTEGCELNRESLSFLSMQHGKIHFIEDKNIINFKGIS